MSESYENTFTEEDLKLKQDIYNKVASVMQQYLYGFEEGTTNTEIVKRHDMALQALTTAIVGTAAPLVLYTHEENEYDKIIEEISQGIYAQLKKEMHYTLFELGSSEDPQAPTQ